MPLYYSPKRDLRMRYTHDAMIDLVISRPEISQNEIASEFGYSPAWVSVVFNSDGFQERLAARKGELVDPILRATIEDRMKAVTNVSLELIHEKLLAKSATIEEAAKVLAITSRALGYGLKPTGPTTVHNYVAVLPPRAETSEGWSSQYRAEAKTIEGASPATLASAA